ncbi:hypothetical protein SCHPADRAFT_104018 [Schizopora paradoxa]|uniref:Uncharacterized protein n=1 Tax=Schizopora paradoxa TaxID=27342 RepID=A0A0H2SP32_9AGAM|nr:hypothetical protein SCHPADRAFT_104018 [Schizopora paradoxa]
MPHRSMARAAASSSATTTGGHPSFSSFFTQILGGYYATAFVRGIEFGIICSQTWFIFRSVFRRKRENPAFRILVAWMTIVALIQTVLSIYRAYYMLIIHFADFTTVLKLTWAGKINFILDTLMIIPSQTFFLWRYWTMSKHNRRISMCLSILLAGCLSSTIAETQKVAGKNIAHSPNDPYFIPYIVFPAVLNASLSACLAWTYLKKQSESQEKRRFISSCQLPVIIWDACLPPTICQWALVISYLASGAMDFWPTVLHGAKGQLSAIAFLIALFVPLSISLYASGCEPG